MDFVISASARELNFTFGGAEPQVWYGPAILSRIGDSAEVALARELQLFGPIDLQLYRWSGELPARLWSLDQLRLISEQLEGRPGFDELLCLWWQQLPAGGSKLNVAAFVSAASFGILQECLLGVRTSFSEVLVRARLEVTSAGLPVGFDKGSPLATPQQLGFALVRNPTPVA